MHAQNHTIALLMTQLETLTLWRPSVAERSGDCDDIDLRLRVLEAQAKGVADTLSTLFPPLPGRGSDGNQQVGEDHKSSSEDADFASEALPLLPSVVVAAASSLDGAVTAVGSEPTRGDPLDTKTVLVKPFEGYAMPLYLLRTGTTEPSPMQLLP